jgi:hypothetical protein
MKQTHSNPQLMATRRTHAELVGRRGELMAELFLQDLEPASIARAPQDFGYDYLVGFPNSKGGINTFGVVVKATERPVASSFLIDRQTYDRLAHSAPPGLLFVADVKHNRLFCAWPPYPYHKGEEGKYIRIPLTEIDVKTKKNLHKQLVA